MPNRPIASPKRDAAPLAPKRRNLIERFGDRFHLSVRDSIATLIPVALLLIVVGYVAQRFVRPAPPKTVVMTVGTAGGAYDAFAKRYQAILARNGITLELHPSSGAVENYERLKADEVDGVRYDVGFVQSGIGSAADAPHLQTIAGVYYEPVWLFAPRIDRLTRLSDLAGKRIGIGIPGSGLRRLATQILSAAGVDGRNATLVDIAGTDAEKALDDGTLDLAFIIGAPESPLLQELFKGHLHVVSLVQSDAVARFFPTLTPLLLPPGAIDLADDRPPHEVKLVAATSLLVCRDDLHPALVYLLLEAANEVHHGPGLFQRRGEFPSAQVQDFPLSEQATRWFQSGRPLLQRYLPFWLANLIERLLVVIVPVVALTIPLMRIVPALYSWRVRSKVFRWYGEVREIEQRALDGHEDDDARRAEADRLDAIEAAVNRLKIPLSFYHEVHLLRAHIEMVRHRLSAAAGGAADGGLAGAPAA